MEGKKQDLARVHEANLKVLKEIDRICRKHHIQYMLDSGTLLGAVRHKGFIPWDDDADVAFTRPNFERFMEAARGELPEGMSLLCPEDFRSGRVFYDFTPRIIYEHSRVHQDSEEMRFYEGKLNHLWVDIFILDRLPDSAWQAEWARLLQKIIYGMAMAHRYKLDFSKYSLPDKLRVGVLAAAGRFVPMRLLFKLQRRVSLKHQHKKTGRWYYSDYQPDYLYVTTEGSWCEEVTELPFEDTHLMVPAGYDPMLLILYGDYMRYPPEDRQRPSHSTIDIEVFESREAGV